jgi:predicted nucleotide-binding protein (sugar kinase/HSP70/actin superfamily)
VFEKAFEKAMFVKRETKEYLYESQKEILDKAIENNEMVFVVAGRPYHADPLIHQKVGQILSDLGAIVLTDDVFRKPESEGFGKLTIVSQWSYPNRVVQSAMEIARLPQNVQLIQLNSFGCGPDSFFMDETRNILKDAGKNITVLRIDEIASPGSIRLRLRSLVESLKALSKTEFKEAKSYQGYTRVFQKEDRKKTLLIPWFADFLSPFIPALAGLLGYKAENLPKTNKISADLGLVYSNNEVCYPATLVIGDIIQSLQSGNYDLRNIVIGMTQTGGQCRATNYLSQIKYALNAAGFNDIPVVALTSGKTYQNEQNEFKLEWKKIMKIACYLLLYGDALQQMHASISVREKKKGLAQEVFDFYVECGIDAIKANSSKTLLRLLKEAVADFNNIPIHNRKLAKVGLIGEIYIKYNNFGQAFISDWLRSKEVEVVTPPIVDFMMQFFVNKEVNTKNGLIEPSLFEKSMKPLIWNYLNRKIQKVEKIMKDFRLYSPSESIYAKASAAAEIIDLSNQFGEGWLVAGEVAHYARKGINKVVCIQPFGCIANHIVARGIEKRLKNVYPNMNLLYLDIDGGVADVNIQNRLHFMIQ